MERGVVQPENLFCGPATQEQWRASRWILEQAGTVKQARAKLEAAEAALFDEQIKLGEYVRDHTTAEIWYLLSADEQEYVINNMPDGAGKYGLPE